MKKFKVLISLALAFMMIASVCSVYVSAAGTTISFSKKSVVAGESVTVTVTLNAGEAMYAVGCVVNYDANIIEYKSGNAAGGAGTLKIVEQASGEKKLSYSLSFTAKKAGSVTITVTDCYYGGLADGDKSISGAGATLTVKDASLSANANLKSLHLSDGSLSPAFSASRTTYEVTVNNSVTECRISAVAEDSAAKVEVTGNAKLDIGKNVRTIVVTAQSGATKTYTVNIVRSETDSVTETPSENEPVEVSVSGEDFILATDISSVKLFEGFTATEVDYEGTKVAVAQDELKEFTIYYLKPEDSDTLVPYLYKSSTGVFEKLQYYNQGEKTYIFAEIPNNMKLPDTYYNTSVTISGMNVRCYASGESNMGEFYYIYCYSSGNYGFCRYDKRDDVLQRYPELSLVSMEENQTDTETGNILSRFGNLSPNAKIIVISLLFIIIALIVLIIIFIIRLVMMRKINELENEMFLDEDFENINESGLILDEPLPYDNEDK